MSSISVDQHVLFIGQRTDQNEKEALQKAGYVHVTGLEVRMLTFTPGVKSEIIGEKLREDEKGHWDSNNGKTVIITAGGEIWLAVNPKELDEEILKRLCPNGRGAFVPLSNQERPASIHDFLARVANPDHGLIFEA